MDAGYESVDEYLVTLIDEPRARIEWKALGDQRRRDVRAKIDKGWEQARRGDLVDPDEVREALRKKSRSERARRRLFDRCSHQPRHAPSG